MSNLSRYLEFRLLAILASTALAIYLLQVLTGFISLFSDVILVLILSWVLAFILDPLVGMLTSKGLSRLVSAVLVYLAIVLLLMAVFVFVIPVTANQLSVLLNYLPTLFSNAPGWAARIETVVTSVLSNSLYYAQTLASFLTGLLLVAIISFYFLLSGGELEKFILDLIPEKFQGDFIFLRKTLNTAFASFLRIQVLIGLIVGLVTFLILWVLSVEFALSAGLLSGILAMIPVVGPLISIFPPILAGATISLEKGLISGAILFLVYQLIYNIVAPKLIGSALKIHPVLVILSFVFGFKLAGFWGAVFAIPVAVSLGIVLKELIKHWREEADSHT